MAIVSFDLSPYYFYFLPLTSHLLPLTSLPLTSLPLTSLPLTSYLFTSHLLPLTSYLSPVHPSSGEYRIRTDDPLLAKQVL